MEKIHAYVVYDHSAKKMYRLPGLYLESWDDCSRYMQNIMELNREIKEDDLFKIALEFSVKDGETTVLSNEKTDNKFIKSIGNGLTLEDVETYSFLGWKRGV